MMRRYSVPTAMTPSSLLKTLTSGPGSRWQAIANTTMRATAIHAASLNVSLTRWPRRAPKFWPATGATENASATTGMNPAWMMRMPMPNPACAAAQAGFGIGIRIIQAGFMPVVALAFSVAPVAGQNFGARLGQRVKDTFKDAAWMAVALMVVFAIACHLLPGPLVSVFSKDEGVIAVGTEYLRIISFNYVASGLVFVASSTFQAMGNTIPSLIASVVRIALVAIPGVIISRLPGFELHWLWWLSVASVFVQLLLAMVLLRREFGLRLAWSSP